MEDRPLTPEKSGSQASSTMPQKLKHKTADIAGTSKESEDIPSKQLKIEDRPLTPEGDKEPKHSEMEESEEESEEELEEELEEESEEESEVIKSQRLQAYLNDLARKAKRDAYLKNLEYGLLSENEFKKLNDIWFDYSMPDDIKNYYEFMKTDSEEKTKDCERCNKDMYEKLVNLYKLGLENGKEKNIPVQGYMRRDIASCPYPLQSLCDCLVTCEQCEMLYCNERNYEGNTAPGLEEDQYLMWQGIFDRASSEDLPDLLNPDGTVYDEKKELEYCKSIKKYMVRETHREHMILHYVYQTSAEERYRRYNTELEKIVKESLINYYLNRNKCRYDHITCKYSTDRSRVLLSCTPEYVRKEDNLNFQEEFQGKWEPY